jgi:anti-anti-sigma factor
VSGKPAPSGTFKIARSGDAVYARVCGLGNMNNSATFKDFIDRMLQEGYGRFIVDLAECRGIDSTFMGILLGVTHDGGRDALVVVNANTHCRRQMEAIGLHRVLRIEDAPAEFPEDLALHELAECEASPIQRLKLIMKAHQDLIAIDRKNEERFGAFLRDVAKNLREQEPPAK